MNDANNAQDAASVDSILNFETVKYHAAEDFETARYAGAVDKLLVSGVLGPFSYSTRSLSIPPADTLYINSKNNYIINGNKGSIPAKIIIILTIMIIVIIMILAIEIIILKIILIIITILIVIIVTLITISADVQHFNTVSFAVCM